MRRSDAALLLLSAAVLGYQVVLVRAFSIGQWHHFAYMVISIALLGFGASGTLLAALETRKSVQDSDRALEKPRVSIFEFRVSRWFALAATLFALTLPLSFWLAQKIPFDPFLIVWERRQLVYLGAYYLTLFVPFFCAATAIGLALVTQAERSAAVYAWNLVGSGAGAALAVGLLALAPAEQAAVAIGALAQGAAVLALLELVQRAVDDRRAKAWAVVGVAGMAAVTLAFAARPIRVRVSQYKGLSYALNLPDARLLARHSSPLGRVDVVSSPAIRHAPGLSLVAPPEAATPPQLGLYVDAETVGAITRFDGDTSKLAYLDWMTTAAPYFTDPHPPADLRVAVLGAGGGAGVLLALRHRAARVDAVELDPNILRLMRHSFRDFNGALYDRPEVRVHRAEARAFLEATDASWDVLDLSLVDSFAAATSGVGAVGESYLYTREAFETFLGRLRPGGRLAITRWVRMPPRDELKVFATACAALEAMGLAPAERIVMLRSWATATLVVKREPFTIAEIAALRAWADARLFDTPYFPGIAPGESNRFNLLDRDEYAEAIAALLAGGPEASGRRQQLFRDYAFHIEPASDHRPYFFHFFRWRALPLMLRSVGAAWIPFVEWGYLILVATLAQAALASAVLIALPLWLLRKRGVLPYAPTNQADKRSPNEEKVPAASAGPGHVSRGQVFLYFLALGLGYLFVEMVLIQRLVFFLANPVYAVAVVLAGLLLFSGLGSAFAARRVGRSPREHSTSSSSFASFASAASFASFAALGVAGVALLYALGLHAALRPLLGLPLAARVGVALVVMLPLAAMGIPFPMGLRQVGRVRTELLPWAWAINGCASVLATALATLLAMSAGLPAVLLAATVCYAAAALVARQWRP